MKFIALWVFFGIINYGLFKNIFKQTCQNNYQIEYGWKSEIFCVAAGILGPIASSILMFMFIGDYSIDLGLCFWMPKELCEPREVKQ